jgi:hypothetical protein
VTSRRSSALIGHICHFNGLSAVRFPHSALFASIR